MGEEGGREGERRKGGEEGGSTGRSVCLCLDLAHASFPVPTCLTRFACMTCPSPAALYRIGQAFAVAVTQAQEFHAKELEQVRRLCEQCGQCVEGAESGSVGSLEGLRNIIY